MQSFTRWVVTCGRTKKEACFKLIWERIHDGRAVQLGMATGATKLHGHPTLTRALHKSGRRLYVEMTFGDTESEVFGSVSMARDVTERAERERAARQTA